MCCEALVVQLQGSVSREKQGGEDVSGGDPQNSSEEITTLVREIQKLHIDDEGLLYRKTISQSQLLLPYRFCELVYKELHEEMGHLGVESVLTLI